MVIHDDIYKFSWKSNFIDTGINKDASKNESGNELDDFIIEEEANPPFQRLSSHLT